MRMLALDARDPGCRATRDALDRYVEAELAGREPDAAIAIHLRRCPACRADHDGLLAITKENDMKLEVITVPVRDVDRALAFYTEQAGFALDVDYAPAEHFRVVQVTPPGSAASLQFGTGLTDAEPGSLRGVTLVVDDLAATRDALLARGVAIGAVRHKAPFPDWSGGFAPGLDPDRTDYASFADFTDPDGNRWTLQEVGHVDSGA
jgi:catechol 2,3-dioxygenase-like lactoylglutathione lyase family enzyme